MGKDRPPIKSRKLSTVKKAESQTTQHQKQHCSAKPVEMPHPPARTDHSSRSEECEIVEVVASDLSPQWGDSVADSVSEDDPDVSAVADSIVSKVLGTQREGREREGQAEGKGEDTELLKKRVTEQISRRYVCIEVPKNTRAFK